MKKRIYILSTLILSITAFRSYAQNLVPNYSFEDTIQCPFLPGQVSFASPWYDPTGASSDYYNACNQNDLGVPDNIEGKQIARTGSAYTGLLTYSQGADFREYIQAKLISKLLTNKKYCMEFYVSLADTQTVAANNIGMYFSDTAISGPPIPVLNVIPQISNDIILNPLTDKTGWTKVSGNFIANGTENYITIGNFLNDANTDTVFVGGGCCDASYYYIDDVSVQCCDCDTSQPNSITVPNVFTPNDDGINDVFKITTKNITTLNCKIYNRWGILVRELTKINEGWDGRSTSGLQCVTGVYYYVLMAMGEDGKEYEEKGFVQLVR